MMKKLIFFFPIALVSQLGIAQLLKPMDSRHEIGLFVGGSNYIGDVGRRNYVHPNSLALGAIYKLNISKRHIFRANATFAHIFAKDADASDLARRQRNLTIENDIYEFGIGWEFNFFKFDPDRKRNHTFYTFAGVSGFLYSRYSFSNAHTFFRDANNNILSTGLANGDPTQFSTTTIRSENLAFSMAIPFGVGYKYKFFERFIIAAELGFRYTFTDNIDNSSLESKDLTESSVEEGLADFNGAPSVIEARDTQTIFRQNFGNSANTDWYVFTGISVTYAFGRAPCYCSKDVKRRKKKFFIR